MDFAWAPSWRLEVGTGAHGDSQRGLDGSALRTGQRPPDSLAQPKEGWIVTHVQGQHSSEADSRNLGLGAWGLCSWGLDWSSRRVTEMC